MKTFSIILIVLSSIIFTLSICFSINNQNKEWFGVGAGLLAICAILAVATEYFFPPKRGDDIKAPNAFSRRGAGVIGIVSGLLWVLSAWPNLFIS